MIDKKIILFDFDGTIADTMLLGVEIANLLSDKHGFQPISKEDIDKYRSQNTQQALKNAGINFLKLPFIVKDFRAQLHKKIHLLQPISGMETALKGLKRKGYELGIVTSNSRKNVLSFLKNHSLQNEFSFIKTKKGIFKKSKVLKSIHKKMGYLYSEILYIGDETRDVEAAKKYGIMVIAVTWGMHTKEVLSQSNPDYLIEKPDELLGLFLE